MKKTWVNSFNIEKLKDNIYNSRTYKWHLVKKKIKEFVDLISLYNKTKSNKD